jgi:excisionase family DNA binding protein
VCLLSLEVAKVGSEPCLVERESSRLHGRILVCSPTDKLDNIQDLMQTTTSELLHVKEAAAELGLHPVTVRRHIASGDLRAVRLGRHGNVRVPREALAEFVRPYTETEK